MMRRVLMTLASLALLGACDSDEPATTQVMLEIDADDAVRARMKTLRIAIAVSDDGGETFRDKLDKTFSEGSGSGLDWVDFAWPARLGLVPEGAAYRLFAVRVQALDTEGEVFVWQQAVAGFTAGRIKVLRMRLSSACEVARLACGEPECIGLECQTCREGDCIEVEILTDLPDYDPSVESDGAVDFEGGVGDGAMPHDGGADSGDDASAPEDAGGDGEVEDAGGDGGCTDCDASEPEPLTASVDDALLDLDDAIVIAFNAALDANTVDSSSVSVRRGDDVIAGTLDVEGATVTLIPDAPLSLAATYRIELSSAIEAQDGRALSATTLGVATRDCTWNARDVAEGDSPHVATAPQGDTVLAYEAQRTSEPGPPGIWVSTRAAADAWTTPVVVTPEGGGLSYFGARASVNDAGEIAIAHYYDTDGYLYASRRTSAGIWSTASVCTQSVPHVYFDNRILPDGMHHVACMIDGDVSIGGSPVTGSGTAGPAIAGFRGGSIVIWSEGAQMRAYTTTDDTSRNAPAGVIARTGIALASDPQHASAVVLWEQVDPTWPNVWSARIIDGATEPTWSAPVRVSNDTSAASMPAVAVDALGRAIAVWQQGSGVTARVHAALLVPGSAWDDYTPLSDPDKGAGTSARIVMEPGGNAFAFWISDVEGGAEVWSARYLTDAGWQLDDRLRLSREGFASTDLQASIDHVGRAHATWREQAMVRTASCE